MYNIPENYSIITDTFQIGDLYKRIRPYISPCWRLITAVSIQSISRFPDFIFIRKITKTEKGNILN